VVPIKHTNSDASVGGKKILRDVLHTDIVFCNLGPDGSISFYQKQVLCKGGRERERGGGGVSDGKCGY
jgi:hypothetical protein